MAYEDFGQPYLLSPLEGVNEVGNTQQELDMIAAMAATMSGGLAIEGAFMSAESTNQVPEVTNLDFITAMAAMSVGASVFGAGSSRGQKIPEGVVADPQVPLNPWNIEDGFRISKPTGSVSELVGVVTVDARQQREQRRIDRERVRQGLPPVSSRSSDTSKDGPASKGRTDKDERKSSERTGKDDRRGDRRAEGLDAKEGKRTRRDTGRSTGRVRSDESQSRTRVEAPKGTFPVLNRPGVYQDSRGKFVDGQGNKIK
jgi:hypothetical protein